MDTLLLKKCWIFVTSMKNMDCAADMLSCIQKLEGERWSQKMKKQYFLNLVQKGIVSPEYNRLSQEQRTLLKSGNATEEQVKALIAERYPNGVALQYILDKRIKRYEE